MTVQAKNIVDLVLELQDRYREAAEVIARTPSGEWRHLEAGGAWPTFRREWQGIDWQGITRTLPSPAEIGRAEELLAWHCWLVQQDEVAARCVYASFARGMKSHGIARALRMQRTTVLKKRKDGLARLAEYVWRARRAAA